jgi:hypothetical protein
MSDDTADLSSVIALSLKGSELMLKGHHARAAEKFSSAVEEAEKALLFPDSLVTCSLRVHQLDALLGHATSSAAKPPDAEDAVREACVRLLPSVMAVLQRRKAAGTLLPGSCRPIEKAYHLAQKRRSLELQGCTQARAAESAAFFAPFVGVETYVLAGSSAAFMFNKMALLVRVLVVPNDQICAACLFLASAVDLMTLPREYHQLAGRAGASASTARTDSGGEWHGRFGGKNPVRFVAAPAEQRRAARAWHRRGHRHSASVHRAHTRRCRCRPRGWPAAAMRAGGLLGSRVTCVAIQALRRLQDRRVLLP